MQTPKLLFRYRSSATTYFFDEIDNALNGNIFLSLIALQNDPFDCYPRHIQSSIRDIKAFEDRFLKRKHIVSQDTLDKAFGKMSRNQRRREKRPFKWTYKNRRVQNKILERMLEQERQNTLIACFSEARDNILMWSHYAHGHKGVCLIFRIVEKVDEFSKDFLPLSIVYTDTRPTISSLDLIKFSNQEHLRGKFTDDKYRVFDALVRQKPSVWSYEKEWRIQHRSSKGPDYYHIPSLRLTGIILGLRMEKSEREEIIEKYSSKLSILEADIDNDLFKINISPG